jgi:hypothetical protein
MAVYAEGHKLREKQISRFLWGSGPVCQCSQFIARLGKILTTTPVHACLCHSYDHIPIFCMTLLFLGLEGKKRPVMTEFCEIACGGRSGLNRGMGDDLLQPSPIPQVSAMERSAAAHGTKFGFLSRLPCARVLTRHPTTPRSKVTCKSRVCDLRKAPTPTSAKYLQIVTAWLFSK